MDDYKKGMGMALVQADHAFRQGEFPVGCVIVENGRVLVTGARQGTGPGRLVFSETDHAEMRAIRELEKSGISFDPQKTVLFCTMEPCLMCYAAIILSGIKTIVYAFEDPMGGGTCLDLDGMTPLYRQGKIRVVPGVMRQKSLDLFYKFFNKETNLYWKDSYLEKYTRQQYAAMEQNK